MLFLNACASVPMPEQSFVQQHELSKRHIIDGVPVIPQKDHYCGPAALAMTLQYRDVEISQDQAADMVYTPGRKGTFQHDIITAIQRKGLLPVPVHSAEDMLLEITHDNPVIIFQNRGLKWYPVWHYSVVRGYDLDEKDLLIHGGLAEPQWKSYSAIMKTWNRAGNWAYVAMTPGDLPASAGEADLLQSAAEFEHAMSIIDQHSKAQSVYLSILDRYPSSSGALFGLGNIEMTLKNYGAAEKYYRDALRIDERHYYSLNNLAYSLDAQNRTREACVMLRDFVEQENQAAPAMLTDSYTELCDQAR
jgi:hypothetical protein